MNPPQVLTRTTSPTAAAPPSMLECDYDVRPTILYKCIQSKAWPRCLQILNHSEHSSQASVWVVRKEPNGKLRWRLLPLHAALIFQAPFHVIEALLEANSEAAASKDDQGMLPLHLALRNRPIQWSTVEELLAAYPAGVYVQDRKGRTPLQGAASASNALQADDGNTVCTNSTLEENNNCAALSVLQLYTQIAVAGERKRLEPPVAGAAAPVDHGRNIQQLEQKHADTLLKLQGLLQKEKQQWKHQLESVKKEKLAQAQQANIKEAVLLKELERLQQQVKDDNANVTGKAKPQICSHCAEVRSPSSPTMQDMRVLELEQENNILRETIEGMYSQHQSLRRSMDRLQDEQRQAQDMQIQHLNSLDQSVQQLHASRQAHIAIWKSQLQQASKVVTEKLAQVGLTSASTDDDGDEDERTSLEQVEIDQDNDESQMSSVVVVRVPKFTFPTTKENSPSLNEPVKTAPSVASETTRCTAGADSRQSFSSGDPSDDRHGNVDWVEQATVPVSLDAAVAANRKAKLPPPVPEGVFTSAACCTGSTFTTL